MYLESSLFLDRRKESVLKFAFQDVTQQKLELEEMRQKVKELMAIKGHLEAEVKVSQRRRRELETELDGGLLDDDGGKGSNKVCVYMDMGRSICMFVCVFVSMCVLSFV